jgi:transposase-like protein
MQTKITVPTTLIEAISFYADEENCQQTMMAIRFPNGVCCPRCGDMNVTRLSRRTVWKCNGCKRQFTMKVGTIFEDSALSFSKWLPAVWMLAGAKNGISSCELARALGVQQKTAWFMLHRIRHAMNTGSFNKPLSGEVEADETYICQWSLEYVPIPIH